MDTTTGRIAAEPDPDNALTPFGLAQVVHHGNLLRHLFRTRFPAHPIHGTVKHPKPGTIELQSVADLAGGCDNGPGREVGERVHLLTIEIDDSGTLVEEGRIVRKPLEVARTVHQIPEHVA